MAHDFPLLLASCMEHNCNDYTVLAELMCVDSMQNLKDAGYRRPGLDALCAAHQIERRGHSALDDAKILKTVCAMKSEEMLHNPYGYTFIDIISYLNTRLPIPLQRVYGLANKYTSHAELEDILYGYVRPKTALNMKQLCMIAYFYFRERSLHCICFHFHVERGRAEPARLFG